MKINIFQACIRFPLLWWIRRFKTFFFSMLFPVNKFNSQKSHRRIHSLFSMHKLSNYIFLHTTCTCGRTWRFQIRIFWHALQIEQSADPELCFSLFQPQMTVSKMDPDSTETHKVEKLLLTKMCWFKKKNWQSMSQCFKDPVGWKVCFWCF